MVKKSTLIEITNKLQEIVCFIFKGFSLTYITLQAKQTKQATQRAVGVFTGLLRQKMSTFI